MSWDPVTQKHKGFAFVEYEIVSQLQFKANFKMFKSNQLNQLIQNRFVHFKKSDR